MFTAWLFSKHWGIPKGCFSFPLPSMYFHRQPSTHLSETSLYLQASCIVCLISQYIHVFMILNRWCSCVQLRKGYRGAPWIHELTRENEWVSGNCGVADLPVRTQIVTGHTPKTPRITNQPGSCLPQYALSTATISLHNFLQAMHICVDMLSLTHPKVISQQCSETFDNILNLANWPKEILSIRRRHQSQLVTRSRKWLSVFARRVSVWGTWIIFLWTKCSGEARLSFGYFHHLVCCTQCVLRMISYGFLKMLPANPHGSCGFTVEVGSMAPLVTVVEGLKVGVATQLLPGLGCFCYFPLDVSYKTHTNCLLTAFKKYTVLYP